MKYLSRTLVALLLFSFSAGAQHAALIVPDFTFLKLDKTSFTNKNLELNKPLFFLFFDASCEHCQHAVQSLNEHYKDFKNAVIYLISLDNPETINRFINTNGKTLYGKKNVTPLQDVHNEFVSKFGARKYPSMFLYSSKRKLIRYEDNEDTMFRFYKDLATSAR